MFDSSLSHPVAFYCTSCIIMVLSVYKENSLKQSLKKVSRSERLVWNENCRQT